MVCWTAPCSYWSVAITAVTATHYKSQTITEKLCFGSHWQMSTTKTCLCLELCPVVMARVCVLLQTPRILPVAALTCWWAAAAWAPWACSILTSSHSSASICPVRLLKSTWKHFCDEPVPLRCSGVAALPRCCRAAPVLQ